MYRIDFGQDRKVFINQWGLTTAASGALSTAGHRGVTTDESPFSAVWDHAHGEAYFLVDPSDNLWAASPSEKDLELVLEALEFTNPGESEELTIRMRKRPA